MPESCTLQSRDEGPRLFFLGAGFSVGAGLPLARDLLDLVLERIHRHYPFRTKLDKSLDHFHRYVSDITGTEPNTIDIEQFCSFLDYEHILGLRGSDTWSFEGNEDQLILRWGIGLTLHEFTSSIDEVPPQYLMFAERLKPADCIVTFNYDLILEKALDAVGKPYWRFPNRFRPAGRGWAVDRELDGQEVLILKVHGSIDWVDSLGFERNRIDLDPSTSDHFVKTHLIFGDKPITTISSLALGPRPTSDPLASVYVVEDLNSYYGNPNVWHHAAPLVLAPSPAKLLYGVPTRELWRGLPRGAQLLGGLGVIGYSLPAGDPYARQVLWDIGTTYSSTFNTPGSLFLKHRITVVDYKTTTESAHEFIGTYRFLDPRRTDFLLDGFDERSVEELFE